MTKKSGVLVALIALVAMIVIGRIAYERVAQSVEEIATTVDTRDDAEGTDSTQETDGTDETADVDLLSDRDATVYTAKDEPVLLSDIADGKPLVINFWATWCPYCVEELPDFQEIYDEFGEDVSFAFVDVADGQRERAEDAAAWLSENGYGDLPDYYDTSLEATRAFGASSLPTTVVVSAEGEVLTISPGMIDPTLLRAALEEQVRS